MSIAVVTGASGGIGAEIAKRLAQDGFSVALIYNRNAEKAQKTADEITLSGGSAKTYKCDVRDSSEITSAIEAIERDFGEISVLVNNAGISEQKLLTDITDSDWENMISTNLSGAFYFCRAVLPYFVHRKSGRIINISSMWGETGGSCEVHYSAAKAGLIGLTKALAKEVAPSGITVNAVSPGVINTEMVTKLGKDTVDMLREEIPVMRLGTPEDVANAVSFLADDKSSYITGQVLSVNGHSYLVITLFSIQNRISKKRDVKLMFYIPNLLFVFFIAAYS